MTQLSTQVQLDCLPVAAQGQRASVSLRGKMGPEDAALTWRRKTLKGIKTHSLFRDHQTLGTSTCPV